MDLALRRGEPAAAPWSASSLARSPVLARAFFLAAGCDEAECLRRTSAARINAAQGRLLAGDDEHALRHIAQADRAKRLARGLQHAANWRRRPWSMTEE